MQATAHGTNGHVNSATLLNGNSGSQLLSISQAADLFAVSPQSLRLWEQQGKLTAYRSPGGHRRYSLEQLQRAFGVNGSQAEEEVEQARKVAVYVRVSSISQKESLSKQRERMLAFVNAEWGLDPQQVRLYSDVASSFGERAGLNRLVQDVLEKKLSVVCVEHRDRLARDSTSALLNFLFQQHGVKVVFAESHLPESEQNLLTEELLAYVTVICNRVSARKSAKIRTYTIDPKAAERARALYEQGIGCYDIWKRLEREGYRNPKNGRRYGYQKINQLLRYSDSAKKLYGEEVEQVKGFIKANCRKAKAGRVRSGEFYERFSRWCQQQGFPRYPNRMMVGVSLRELGFERYHASGGWEWLGLELAD